MTIDDMSKYDELKEFLLTEYKLILRSIKFDSKRLLNTPIKHTFCLPLGYVIFCHITLKAVLLRIMTLSLSC